MGVGKGGVYWGALSRALFFGALLAEQKGAKGGVRKGLSRVSG